MRRVAVDLDGMAVAIDRRIGQISIIVRSGPMPARASAAATLTLAGNPTAASRAVPEKTSLGPLSPSSEMPFASS